MKLNEPILSGNVFSRNIEGWNVSWESNLNYRHWCNMQHPANNDWILIVLFNPGSLSHSGENLSIDSTLRILRKVFKSTNLNPFIINLFDFSDPKYKNLSINWEKRDHTNLIYDKIVHHNFRWILYAYGKIDKQDPHYLDIIDRINYIRNIFTVIPEINIFNQNKHPIQWQITKDVNRIHDLFVTLQEQK